MKHNFRTEPSGDAAARFLSWLEEETISSLQRSYGQAEMTESYIFLFVHRAYEAHMSEDQIGEMFGRCVVRAGYQESEEDPAFAWLEHFAELARNVHG
jgi:hypothetical protein